jgi:hypothetical protein
MAQDTVARHSPLMNCKTPDRDTSSRSYTCRSRKLTNGKEACCCKNAYDHDDVYIL